MKKLLILFFVSQIIFGGSWRISLDPAHLPDFANLQEANDNSSVVNGDTLYIAGNPANYPTATITKKLIIIGTGYFFNDNGFYNGTTNVPATLESVTFEDGSEGSVITSCIIQHLKLNEKEILIKRNNISWIELTEYSASLIITQNYLGIISWTGIEFVLNNCVITNNYIYRVELGKTNNTLVSNNTIGWGVFGSYFVFHNNIIFDHFPSLSLTDCDVRNNLIHQPQEGFDPALGNQVNIDMDEVFISLTVGSQDARYHLRVGSPAIGAGINGVDCGMFGGDNPYQLSGLPAIPIIYEMIVPTIGTIDEGLNITIKARTNN
ncbi:MAG: hypothetical protein RBS48_03810 [Ignavibacteriaceae bacterium]|jgi:hypothetical protein|nr:hypothetical protein [Ignavibacteriaceae bacterium]